VSNDTIEGKGVINRGEGRRRRRIYSYSEITFHECSYVGTQLINTRTHIYLYIHA
jgi:hypothetical protein